MTEQTSVENAPHVPAAFINAIAEEGTKAEAIEYLQKTWNELCALRSLHAQTVDLTHAFRNADAKDWEHLDLLLGHSGHGKFWRAVFAEVRAALAPGNGAVEAHSLDELVAKISPDNVHPEFGSAAHERPVSGIPCPYCFGRGRLATVEGSVSSTNRTCKKCGSELNGEAAQVGDEIWCHPCADAAT